MRGGLDWSYNGGVSPGDTFLEVVRQLIKEGQPNITESLKMLVRKHTDKESPTPVSLTRVQEIQLDKAKKFSKGIGLFTEGFPIIVVETLGQGILGLAKKGTIYLAVETFEMGTKMVAITLIEEWIHLKHGHRDMTRDMQNMLFNKIVSLGEELVGEPL